MEDDEDKRTPKERRKASHEEFEKKLEAEQKRIDLAEEKKAEEEAKTQKLPVQQLKDKAAEDEAKKQTALLNQKTSSM